MAITVGGTTITFNDSTTQSTAGGSNVNTMVASAGSGTWTKPATVKSIKVTVVGGGGSVPGFTPGTNGGRGWSGGGGGGGAAIKYYPAASLPGPQPYTVGGAGGTSAFGAAPIGPISATGGASAPTIFNASNISAAAGGAGGSGSGGTVNFTGQGGGACQSFGVPGPSYSIQSGAGGASIFGGGGGGSGVGGGTAGATGSDTAGTPGGPYGGGGAGGSIRSQNPGFATPGTSGAPGVVIIEEFY